MMVERGGAWRKGRSREREQSGEEIERWTSKRGMGRSGGGGGGRVLERHRNIHISI
jgi:hypothetical protein